VAGKHIAFFHCVVDFDIQPSPNHGDGEVELRYCETDKASLAHAVDQNFLLDVLHAQTTSTSATECKKVALQFWIIKPSLRLKGERLGKYGRVRVQEIGRLHNWRTARNGVLLVHKDFMSCDARLAGRYAVRYAETFVDHCGL
jgi:hypothetical protein